MNPTDATIPSEIIEKIEKELLEHIIESMRQRAMPLEKAHELAKDFINNLPIHDKKDLLQKLNELAKKYPEAQGVYLSYAKPAEKEERERKLEAMAKSIKSGNLDEAISIAKGDK